MEKEVFFFDFKPSLEKQENKPARLVGYGIKFDVLSHDLGGYRAVFRRDTFDDLGDGPLGDLKAYYQHDYERGYLARTDNGTFKIEKDDIGIKYSIELPPTQLGRDVEALAERDDIVGASLGVVPTKVTLKREPQGLIREFTKAQLVEISAVHEPAFPYTTSELVRASLEEFLNQLPPEEIKTPNLNRAKRILQLLHR